MTNDAPSIILIAPQMGENIGAAARAMANFGLMDLKIVRPRNGWPSERAEANAVGALDVINPVEVLETTAEALEGFHTVYATTARPRDMRKNVMTPHSAIQDMRHKHASNQKTAILFGGERAGLSNEDIALAHNIISVPVNPEFSSLNLAQSVLLIAYEWLQSADNTATEHLPTGGSAPVTHEELHGFIDRLEDELDTKNFFRNEDMRPSVMRNIRNIFSRINMSEQEVKTFHGIISALIGNKGKN